MIKSFLEPMSDNNLAQTCEVICSGQIQVSRAALFQKPCSKSAQVSQLLLGEQFYSLAFKEQKAFESWHLVKSKRDGYQGYLHSPLIETQLYQPNAIVIQLSTTVYCAPNMKAAIVCELPFGASLYIESLDVKNASIFYYSAHLNGWIYKSHLQLIADAHPDPVSLARRFIGLGYMWGGRSGWGCDCSSLVQLCYEVCGYLLPRDTHLQEKNLTINKVDRIQRADIRAGDLVFWPGHVAIASSSTDIIHATCVGMHVVEEPLIAVEKRIYQESKRQINSIQRLIKFNTN
jgi:cell wall-associated NlpC family hydrolase